MASRPARETPQVRSPCSKTSGGYLKKRRNSRSNISGTFYILRLYLQPRTELRVRQDGGLHQHQPAQKPAAQPKLVGDRRGYKNPFCVRKRVRGREISVDVAVFAG